MADPTPGAARVDRRNALKLALASGAAVTAHELLRPGAADASSSPQTVYVGDTEPTGAAVGSVWIETNGGGDPIRVHLKET